MVITSLVGLLLVLALVFSIMVANGKGNVGIPLVLLCLAIIILLFGANPSLLR